MQLGADPVQLARLAASFEDVALALGDTIDALVAHFRRVTWRGRDRDQCADAVGRIRSTVHHAMRSLTSAARGLRRQADDQRRVSDSAIPATGRAPEAELIHTDADDGHRVTVVGDLAAATHVAVLIPGVGTDAGNFDSTVHAAQRLHHEAATTLGDPAAVAVVAWLDYDAPDGLGEPWHVTEMLTDDAADQGAARLRRFVAGITALSTADGRADLDISLIGHSYGSLVAAKSASAPGVDRVVLLGSPGVGVDSAAALGVDPRHVLTVAAPSDVIAHLGWFGAEPTSDEFGALVLDAEPVPGHPAPGIGHAHSSYFDDGSTSLANIAAAVVARPVRNADGRTVALAPAFSAAR